MGFLNFFRRGNGQKNKVKEDATLVALQGEMGRPFTEEEWRSLLRIDYELLHDDALENLLENQMYSEVTVKNHDGTEEKQVLVNYDIAALRTLITHLNRTSFIPPSEAELIKLYMEAAIVTIEMQMPEDAYNLGIGNFLDALDVFVRLMVNDAINGRKAKLIKTIPRATTISFREEKETKGWI